MASAEVGVVDLAPSVTAAEPEPPEPAPTRRRKRALHTAVRHVEQREALSPLPPPPPPQQQQQQQQQQQAQQLQTSSQAPADTPVRRAPTTAFTVLKNPMWLHAITSYMSGRAETVISGTECVSRRLWHLFRARKQDMQFPDDAIVHAAADGELDAVIWFHQVRGFGRLGRCLVPAAAAGHEQVVDWLLNVAPDSVLPHLTEALQAACGSGSASTVAALFAAGAVLTSQCSIEAAKHGSVPTLDLLLVKGARVSNEKTVCSALQHGHLAAAKWCAKHDAPLTAKAVEAAAIGGNLEAVQWVVESLEKSMHTRPEKRRAVQKLIAPVSLASEPHAEQFISEAAVCNAAAHGHDAIVRWLLSHSSAPVPTVAMALAAASAGYLNCLQSIHAACPPGTNVLTAQVMSLAARFRQAGIVSWLQQASQAQPPSVLLQSAAEVGMEDTVRELLLSPDITDSAKEHALVLACRHGHAIIVELLLGAHTTLSRTALRLAVASGSVPTVRACMNALIQPPLWLLQDAVACGKAELVEFLLQQQYPVTERVMQQAASVGKPHIIRLLLAQRGRDQIISDACVRRAGIVGNVAALEAFADAAAGHHLWISASTIAALAEAGQTAALHVIVTRLGGGLHSDALTLAARNGHTDTVSWLLRHGLEPTTAAIEEATKAGHGAVVACLQAAMWTPRPAPAPNIRFWYA